MDLLGGLLIAFSMYSRIPMPRVEWSRERMRYAMCFFPLIGVVLGAVFYGFNAAAVWLGMGRMGKAMFGAAIPLILTGGIHMDGFLDVTDARCSYGDREKKLDILKDPHTGAFAIIGFGLYELLYIAALSELNGKALALFSGTFVVTRALSGLAVVTFPMARKDGLAVTFSEAAVKRPVRYSMYVYLAAAAFFLVGLGGLSGALLMLAALLCFVWYYRMSLREFGGITGDLAGYFLQILELVLLLILCVLSLAAAR